MMAKARILARVPQGARFPPSPTSGSVTVSSPFRRCLLFTLTFSEQGLRNRAIPFYGLQLREVSATTVSWEAGMLNEKCTKNLEAFFEKVDAKISSGRSRIRGRAEDSEAFRSAEWVHQCEVPKERNGSTSPGSTAGNGTQRPQYH